MLQMYLIALAVIVVVALSFLSRRSFLVEESVEIEADREKIWEQIVDFRNWPAWSPWLPHEPDCKLTYSPESDKEGSWEKWDGSLIGSGKITHVKISDGLIRDRLESFRPHIHPYMSEWRLDEVGEKRFKLTWSRRGAVPWLLWFAAKGIKVRTQRDYQIGLHALARVVNPDHEAPRLSFAYPVKVDSQHYLGSKHRCAMAEVGTAIQEQQAKLSEFLQSHNVEMTGSPLTIYTQRDFKRGSFGLICALPIASEDADKIQDDARNAGFETGIHEPDGEYVETVLEGDYRFLGLAWLAAFDHLKIVRLKFDWKRSPFEIYDNSPDSVDNSNEIRTRIFVGGRPEKR